MTTQLVDDRESALRVGYEATDWSAPVLFEDYRNSVKDWIIKAIKRDDEIIGAVYRKDDESCFCSPAMATSLGYQRSVAAAF
jgi:hypothetical protein